MGEPAESPAREIGDELAEAAGRIEAGMRIRRRVHHHRAPRERLHLVTHATEQLAVRVDRLELGRRELERQWQQEPLGRRPVARELAHRPLVQDRKSTRLNSSHDQISYAVFCLKKKKKN